MNVAEVELEGAATGTFPVFTEDGFLPGHNSDFNALQSEMTACSALFERRYSVRVQEELPLAGFSSKKYKALSKTMIPTHRFEFENCFILKTRDRESNLYPMYVLPAAHYCEMVPMTPYTGHCPLVGSVTWGGKEYPVYDIRAGYLMHNGKVYPLQSGWMIAVGGSPKVMHLMAKYKEELAQQRDAFHEFDNKKILQSIFRNYLLTTRQIQREFSRIANNEEIASLFRYHARCMNRSDLILMKVFYVLFKPRLHRLQPDVPEGYKHLTCDEAELFFYKIYVASGGFYWGPAPPYSFTKSRIKPRRTREEQTRLNFSETFGKEGEGKKCSPRAFLKKNRETSVGKRALKPGKFGTYTPRVYSSLYKSEAGIAREPSKPRRTLEPAQAVRPKQRSMMSSLLCGQQASSVTNSSPYTRNRSNSSSSNSSSNSESSQGRSRRPSEFSVLSSDDDTEDEEDEEENEAEVFEARQFEKNEKRRRQGFGSTSF